MSSLLAPETGPQPPREVRSPIEINALLKTLLHSRDQLIVSFPERSQKFQSFIVAIDPAGKQLWIDELVPKEGDRYITEGESFRIDAWHEGVHMRWHCVAAQRVILEGAPAYCAALPEQLIYHQKRGAFRAVVQRPLETGVTLHSETFRLSGHLFDVSATGCKALFASDQAHALRPGAIIEACQLDLPEIGTLDLAVEVRHVSYDEKRDESHVGLRFRQPSPQAQRQVDRFVNYLQREARRLEKRDDLF
ncbi:pilus assembly protein PilZ [Pseudomonas sp. gcc21]|uniref:flagellar brake protein n=1 Tax=Pseudomonas sp. gcc21 TaxID=2726989 RepID=UPI001451E207|nr:flagellar brake protein [Pseudomonas sp. gcc21]QJD57675.1 pilus assembly protein PilZ [Pseudomonas sp. gcc21]